MADFLPVATDSPATTVPAATSAADAIDALAQVLSTDDTQQTNVRFGAVTSVSDPNTAGRVQLDITDTAWCSRASDVSLAVGDRVIAVQQGPVLVVIGRLSGGEAQPIGSLVSFAGSTAPTGWLLCDGSSKLRSAYPALFAVIGTTYGSADGTHFNVPNLVNRVPVGSGGTYTRGGTGGAATVTLTSGQMPSHSHSFGNSTDSQGSHSHSGSADSNGDHSHSVGNQTTRSDISAAAGSTVASNGGGSTGSAGGHSHSVSIGSGGGHTHSISGSTDTAGSGSAHENMPPYLAVPYIIRAL